MAAPPDTTPTTGSSTEIKVDMDFKMDIKKEKESRPAIVAQFEVI